MGQKRMGKDDFSKIPNGAPGVENRMELLFSEGVLKKRISINKFVDLTATAPARIFGLYPRKGCIAVGSDADIVIFDPLEQHIISATTHHMNCDYNLYEGWQVTGKCRSTILRGTLAVDRGQAFIGKGFGKYIARGRAMSDRLVNISSKQRGSDFVAEVPLKNEFLIVKSICA
jgi:dihydropyrimidinase